MQIRKPLLSGVLLLSMVRAAAAADLGIAANQLMITDEPRTKAIRFSAHNHAGLQKGPAGATTDLDGQLEVFYTDTPGTLAKFLLPFGAGWRVNAANKARYVSSDAGVQRATIRNGRALQIKSKGLGDHPSWKLDLAAAGDPGPGGITTILTLRNAADSSLHRMCTRFSAADGSAISFRTTRNGFGRKLIARRGVPVDCGRISYVRMEPELTRSFFALPWPNDIRVLANGSLDMASFPIPDENALVRTILSNGAAVTTGFGTNSAVFFQIAAPLDTNSLPSPANSTQSDSTVMLVNLDAPATARVPVLIDLKETIGQLRPPDLLSLLPYPGHPLTGSTRYAAILFAGLQTPQGTAFAPAPLLAELDEPWDTSKPVDATKWASLQAQRDAVYDYVSNHTGWTAADVVAFTVFTTQDVTAELQAIAAAVEAMPQPTPLSRSAGNCSGGVQRTTVNGQLRLPHWQAGTFPYIGAGGGIVIAGGMAVQQFTETAAFQMTFPCGPAPANGWPILLFMSGTGGGVNSSNITYMGGASATNPLPYVVASVAPLYSGDRYVAGLFPPFDQSEFLYFNYLNPLAGRTNQLQQVGDMMYLRRVVEGITLSAAETGNAAAVATDDSIEVIAGHSQGALTIPLTLAVDPHFGGAFLSAGGAGLYQTILHRGDVRAPLTAFIGSALNELDMFHPVVHAVQTFAEIGDAANYAPLVSAPHILSTSGLIDGCSPVEVVSILGTALGLHVANPLYYPVFGTASLETPTTSLPASGNLPGARTGVTVQLNGGHFAAVTNPNLGRSFADSLASGGVPAINPGALLPNSVPGCARWDPLP